MSILNHVNAGYPLICVNTFDDSAVRAELESVRETSIYAFGSGILQSSNANAKTSQQIAFGAMIKQIAEQENRAVMVRDANHVIANPPIYRALLDALTTLKSNGSSVVLVAPSFGTLPPELTHVAPLISLPLPTREQLAAPLAVVAESANIEINGNRAALLDGAAGLTLDEAENAFALSLVESGALDASIVAREKMRTLGATGFLSVENPRPLSDVGGLGQFKAYLANEVIPLWQDPQLRVRGILLAGLPGTGKSLSARATAAAMGLPLVRCDMGACKGGLVGQSEANIRRLTAILEAVAPCVAWFDEVDKAFAGHQSSGKTDSGTTSGMIGHMLTWWQDHTAPILTLATCNSFEALPDALTRAGRFDERFCVDLPTASEREQIALVHLRRLNCSHEPELATRIASATDSYSGAEIEQLVKSAARFSARAPKAAHVEQALASIKPLAIVNREAVEQFRQWSRNTLRFANDVDTSASGKPARRVAVAS